MKIKKVIIVISVFLVAFSVTSLIRKLIYERETQNPTTVFIEDEIKNLGALSIGDRKKVVFHLLNIGDNKLHIQKISASCGCTVPVLPESLTNIGDSCEIVIWFTANSTGYFNRNVLVFSNDTLSSPHKLTITGKVISSKNL